MTDSDSQRPPDFWGVMLAMFSIVFAITAAVVADIFATVVLGLGALGMSAIASKLLWGGTHV